MDTTITIDLRQLARSLKLPVTQVQAVVELLDDGNTVPFITRYRKDQTGGLDEEQIRQIQTRLERLRTLADRKRTILRAIEAQGKLDEALLEQISSAGTSKRLEDLYLPFKPRKQQLAATARERGLEPLAREILDADPLAADLDQRAAQFADPDKQVPTAAEVLLGTGHIIAEIFSEKAEVRQKLREILNRTGRIETIRIAPEIEGENEPPKGKKDAKSEASDKKSEESTEEKPAEAKSDESAAPSPEDKAAAEVETTEPAAEATAEPAEVTAPTDQEQSKSEPEAEEKPAEEATSSTPQAESETPTEPETAAEKTTDSTETSEELPKPAEEKTEAESADAQSKTETESTDTTKPRVVPIPKEDQKQASRRQQQRKQAEIKKIRAFADYFEYSETLTKVPPHRVLAINRGEREKILRVKLVYDTEPMLAAIDELLVPADHPHADYLRGCARDAMTRLILPSLERETRRELTDQAEAHAVKVFARNLKSLLLQRPVHDHRVLAIDPGFRSGCKLAALDQFGNVLGHGVVYLIGRSGKRQQSKRKLLDLIDRYKITVIAIGNGTACRETEAFVAAMLTEQKPDSGIGYVIVNEAGASVYSTSPIGREEFPTYDATLRGAISIGRRLLDPLSELVKIDPASIGVGLYQHDVKGKHLRASLEDVVESSVNHVGVDPNTASPVLLRYVAGLKSVTAQRIFEYRRQNGPFRSRKDLLDVPGIGEATYIQAAGFLKIERGDCPLDATWIHPESYDVTTRLLEKIGFSLEDVCNREKMATLDERLKEIDLDALAGELEIGRMALDDIIYQLKRPGRDPREDLPETVFKKGIIKIEDLEIGTELTGTVSNVVDFGAFVDIGLHDSGLVHVSRLADRYVREAHEVVSVGDIVTVWVTAIDKERRRISLTMIKPGTEKKREGRRRRRGEGGPQGESQGEGGEAKQGERRRRRPRREAGDQQGGPRKEGESGNKRREGSGRGRGGEGGRREGGRREGGRRDGRRGRGDHRRPRGPIVYEFRAEKEETKLTEEVVEGKEPMRSFGELAKLFEIRHGDEVEQARNEGGDSSKPKRKRRRRGKKSGEADSGKTEAAPSDSKPEEKDTPTVESTNEPTPSSEQAPAPQAEAPAAEAPAVPKNPPAEPESKPEGDA